MSTSESSDIFSTIWGRRLATKNKKNKNKKTKKQKTIFKYSWRTLGEDLSPAQHVNDIVTIVLFDSSFPHPILNKASYLAQQLLDWLLM